MADTNTTPNPDPITDTNHNGILDGQDLKLLLSQDDTKPTIDQHVRGVLAQVDILKIAAQWNNCMEDMKANGKLSVQTVAKYKDRFANDFGDYATIKINEYLALLRADPNYLEKDLELTRQSNQSTETTALALADKQAFADFAQHFHQDFPGGIHVDPDDIIDILHYFGGVNPVEASTVMVKKQI